MQLEIITPEKSVYSDTVDAVTIPTVTGEITVLPHHVPLVSQIASGELVVKKGNKDQSIAITGGFLEVNNNIITVLADYAVRSEEIEIAKAEEAKKRAEKMAAETVGKEGFAEAEAALRRSLLELHVATKRKHRPANPTA